MVAANAPITMKEALYGGRKFEHARKHGLRNDLYVVTLGWFVDVRKNGESKQLLVSVQLMWFVTGLPFGDILATANVVTYEVVNFAIHLDWKHANRLRSTYVDKESLESDNVQFKRVSFLGTVRSFEML
ncbi:hypothetical protein IFM89_039170 [Coptis chinensis]|uniref:Uncharacterized protein n=1 Tax=Coptis chinensis TaxID=261450 RepID=A0A835M349_9MAGN|nr:hypothetical protein IFM89_039170 [Coptis chinensis]